MIKREKKYIVCDICETTITNKHVYPRRHGLKWIFSTRRTEYLPRLGRLHHSYDIQKMDFCGDCWRKIVEQVRTSYGG